MCAACGITQKATPKVAVLIHVLSVQGKDHTIFATAAGKVKFHYHKLTKRRTRWSGAVNHSLRVLIDTPRCAAGIQLQLQLDLSSGCPWHDSCCIGIS